MQTVLIFDDDADILELCSLILASKGLKTVGKLNCSQLIETVNTIKPAVILMDNWIPDIGGIAACRALKATESTRSIPLIFFTASNNVEKLSLEAGADYYIPKPFDIAQLEKVVLNAARTKPIKFPIIDQ